MVRCMTNNKGARRIPAPTKLLWLLESKEGKVRARNVSVKQQVKSEVAAGAGAATALPGIAPRVECLCVCG